MASGKFASSVYKGAGTGYYRYIEVVWTSENDTANNKSTITWEAYSRSPDSSKTGWVLAKNIVVTINGTATTVVGSTETKLYKDGKLGGSSITVEHGSNGKKSVDVSITAQIYVYGATNSSYSGTITLSPNPVYNLSISARTGSNITVNRTACAGSGSTGKLSSGTKKLYHGDKLKITFTPSTNYAINTHKVNNTTFTSGNTHTVSGNVTVVATSTPLKSVIGAIDANIESNSVITVTRYNTSYTHTITYEFGSATGTIVSKSTNTSISWTIPATFYTQIPNAKAGICTLTCETFNGNTSLGSSTCKITVTASPLKCTPTVDASVIDTNEITKALTGDSSTLIRYKSTALCTLNATPKNSAAISSMSIAGSPVTGVTNNGITIATKSYSSVSSPSFKFVATDSRGYDANITKTPIMIAYTNLSCNPVLSRPEPTGSSIVMTFTGDIFRGSFGACSNTLTLQYRYKESGGSYNDDSWQSIESTDIVFGTNTYHSSSSISVGDNFDYQKDYVFQIKATDGGIVDDVAYTLSTVIKTVSVKRGIPVFDWGESDFAFNVPVRLPSKQFRSNQKGGGLDAQSSDITGVNALYFDDVTTSGEGLLFPTDTTGENFDIVQAYGGNLYFIPNYPTNTTSYKMCATPGDVISIRGNTPFSAYVSDGSKRLFFTIPINKPIVGVTTVALEGSIEMRGVTGRLYNIATGTSRVNLNDADTEQITITLEVTGSVIYVNIQFSDTLKTSSDGTTSIGNNTSATVSTYGTLKIKFS